MKRRKRRAPVTRTHRSVAVKTRQPPETFPDAQAATLTAADRREFKEYITFATTVWPFPRLGLERFLVSDSLREAVPLFNLDKELAPVYAADRRRRLHPTPLPFARLCDELDGHGIRRAELARLSDVPVALYEWVIALSRRLAAQRRVINRLERRYRDLLGRAKADGHLPETAGELERALAYLRQFPTQQQLRRWRRRLGINRDASLGQLRVWATTWNGLADAIRRGLKIYDQHDIRQRDIPAERYAVELLRARYPEFPELTLERLRRRK